MGLQIFALLLPPNLKPTSCPLKAGTFCSGIMQPLCIPSTLPKRSLRPNGRTPRTDFRRLRADPSRWLPSPGLGTTCFQQHSVYLKNSQQDKDVHVVGTDPRSDLPREDWRTPALPTPSDPWEETWQTMQILQGALTAICKRAVS